MPDILLFISAFCTKAKKFGRWLLLHPGLYIALIMVIGVVIGWSGHAVRSHTLITKAKSDLAAAEFARAVTEADMVTILQAKADIAEQFRKIKELAGKAANPAPTATIEHPAPAKAKAKKKVASS
jgi:hypothetical protein